MRIATLHQRLRDLVAVFGKDRVLDALSRIEADHGSADIERNDARISTRKRSNSSKSATENQYVRLACQDRPDVKSLLARLGSMYQSGTYLRTLREVSDFLRAHEYASEPRSRIGALKNVMAVLVQLPRAELEEITKSAIEQHEVGDFMLLANTIMGKTAKSQP